MAEESTRKRGTHAQQQPNAASKPCNPRHRQPTQHDDVRTAVGGARVGRVTVGRVTVGRATVYSSRLPPSPLGEAHVQMEVGSREDGRSQEHSEGDVL